jgi:ATP-dependent Clp protease adaptor protein ClpS
MSTQTISKSKTRTAIPPQYKVLLLNDDYTPMDFVMFVLMRFFRKDEAEARQVMLEAHHQGMSVAGIYPFEIAETKVAQVLSAAQAKGYPLKLELEPE